MTEQKMWTCAACTAEYTSPLAAALCEEDDNDRHNTRGYD